MGARCKVQGVRGNGSGEMKTCGMNGETEIGQYLPAAALCEVLQDGRGGSV